MLRSLLDGAIFAQCDLGGGPVCVMLHGWGRTSSDFAGLNAALVADGISTLLLDLPGFGASPPPEAAMGSSQYAKVVIAAIEEAIHELDDRRYLLVGHSFGGRVALEAGAMHPANLEEIFVSGVPLFRDPSGTKPAWAYRLVRRGAAMGLVSTAKLESYKERYGSKDYRAASGVMREIFVKVVNEDYSETLRRIEVPVHFVWGQHDSAAPLGQARRALTLVKSGTLEVIEGADHFQPILSPALLVTSISSAVARLALQSGETQE